MCVCVCVGGGLGGGGGGGKGRGGGGGGGRVVVVWRLIERCYLKIRVEGNVVEQTLCL